MENKTALARLGALAHEGRLALFRLLVQAGNSGMPVGELAAAAQLNFTTASAQLSVLSQSGLISGQRQGRSIIYSVDFTAVAALLAFLMKDCCGGSDARIAACCELLELPFD